MEKLRIKLEKWVNGGYCLAHADGHAVFVEGGIPGELVDITLTKQGSKEWYGNVHSVVEASSLRIPSNCPVSNECGGCSYRHITYEEELKLKRHLLESMFPDRKGKLEVIFGPEEGYRNNVQWQVDGNQLGLFAKNSHRIISESSIVCKNVNKRLLAPKSNEWKSNLKTPKNQKLPFPSKHPSRKKDNSLFLRLSGENVVSYDREETQITLMNTQLKVPSRGFFQINQFLIEPWLKTIQSLLPEKAHVLELFCGCGTIGITLREKIASLYGIESHDKSILYAKKNAKANGIQSFQYETKDLYQRPLSADFAKYPIWLVNPPRAGLSKGIMDSASELKPSSIIYSSCNPSTLLRDVSLFDSIGYEMDAMYLFDFFPRTHHYEVLVRMKHKNNSPL